MPWLDMHSCHTVGLRWRWLNASRSADNSVLAFENFEGGQGSPRRSVWRTLLVLIAHTSVV